ncbi:MAG: hypothetical protein FWH18_07255 [Marinilabiliaceae bacterium]|nr:hypothetical protein [Marinilabiliaceae bacterium]
MEQLNQETKIELHHESIEEILGTPPNILLRAGSGILLFVIAGLLVGSIFFTYPDIVQAPAVLRGELPLATLTVSESGQITNVYKDCGNYVRLGDTLFVIEKQDKSTVAVIAENFGILETSPLIIENYIVQKNDTIALIWGDTGEFTICIIHLSPENGKNVRAGNKLRLHIDKYPSERYGTVESLVKSVSRFNTGKDLIIIAELPLNIVTTTQFEFTARGNIYASAEIITGEKTMFNRLVNPFRGLINK